MDTFPRPRSLRSSARGSLQYSDSVIWYKRPSASSPMERDLRPVVVVQHPPGRHQLWTPIDRVNALLYFGEIALGMLPESSF